MRLSNKDYYFFVISLVIFVFFGWALYADLNSFIEKSDGVRLGTVVFKKRIAQRKYDDQVIWETIPNHSVLYVNDSIRTAEDSEAMLLLDDGTRIDLGEDTLVVLVRTGRRLGINFQQGTLSALAGGVSGSGFEVISGDARLDLTQADASFKKGASSADLLVDVTRGRAVFQKGGERVAVQENSQIVLKAGAAPQVKQVKLIPKGGAGIVFTDTARTAHTFSWRMSGTDRVTLDVSRNAAFARDTQSYTTAGQEMTLDLGEGTWFWRVRAPDGSLSRVERTMLVLVQPPRPLSPANGARFMYFVKTPLVSLQWRGDENAGSYTVEIAKDANFAETVRSVRSRGSSIAVDNLPEGRYWWRVTAQYTGALRAPKPGAASSFIIGKAANPPVVEVPASTIVSTLQLEARQAAVSWKGSPEYAKYRLELSTARDFSRIAYAEETTANFSRLKSNIPGAKYYWRIYAMDSRGEILARTAVAEVDIQPPRPAVLMTPVDGAVVQGDSGETRVAFSWDDPNKGGRTRFEVASDAAFRNVRHDIVSSKNTHALALPSGEYFWRVAAVNTKGGAVTEAEPRRLSVVETLASPVLRQPLPGAVIDVQKVHSITFTWNRVEHASRYRIALYRPQGYGWQMVHEAEAAAPTYTLTQLNRLARGRHAWEVQALPRPKEKARYPGKPSRSEFILQLPAVKGVQVNVPDVLYTD